MGGGGQVSLGEREDISPREDWEWRRAKHSPPSSLLLLCFLAGQLRHSKHVGEIHIVFPLLSSYNVRSVSQRELRYQIIQ